MVSGVGEGRSDWALFSHSAEVVVAAGMEMAEVLL
jgi:hypothetical protein